VRTCFSFRRPQSSERFRERTTMTTRTIGDLIEWDS